jgi:hypothetical protein
MVSSMLAARAPLAAMASLRAAEPKAELVEDRAETPDVIFVLNRVGRVAELGVWVGFGVQQEGKTTIRLIDTSGFFYE